MILPYIGPSSLYIDDLENQVPVINNNAILILLASYD
jgi:hypothetical protein